MKRIKIRKSHTKIKAGMSEDGSRCASAQPPYVIERQTGQEHPVHPEQENKEVSLDPFVREHAFPNLMIKFI